MMARFCTRFAPSPTGYLHLGHAFSALTAWDMAQARGGKWLLRIEDLDGTRARPEFETAIFNDLCWLGLDWPEPALRQSDHLTRYAAALDRLADMGLTYPCCCTRADIKAALSAPQENAIPAGGLTVYPGTCRSRSMADWQPGDAIRLDLAKSLGKLHTADVVIHEVGPVHRGRHRLEPVQMRRTLGDVVLGRRDTSAAAYHLAVVVDDALQDITHVVRGADLWEATALHRLLQALLGLPQTIWHHHALVRDEAGRRLAKRDDARSLGTLRADGLTPSDIRARLGLVQS